MLPRICKLLLVHQVLVQRAQNQAIHGLTNAPTAEQDIAGPSNDAQLSIVDSLPAISSSQSNAPTNVEAIADPSSAGPPRANPSSQAAADISRDNQSLAAAQSLAQSSN